MIPFFKELFEYNHHYNQKLLEVVQTQQDKTSEKAVTLFNHLLNAHHIWNNRIQGIIPALAVWQVNKLEALDEILHTNYLETLKILDNKDLSEIIEYKTSKGDPFKNSSRDILFHVINHSTYHRGQIATEFKNNGIDPLITDYVFFKR